MNSENEAYLNHLKSQLQDLKSKKSQHDEILDEINELEQNCQVLKQEKSENETQLEESIKTHTKILESVKAENSFMMKNLYDKQVMAENSFQILNSKNNDLFNLKNGIQVIDSKLETIKRLTEQTNEKLSACKLKIGHLNSEKARQHNQISENKTTIMELNEIINQLKNNEIEAEKDYLIIEKKKENLSQVLEQKSANLMIQKTKLNQSQTELLDSKINLEQKTKKIQELKNLTNQLSVDFKLLSSKHNEENDNNKDIESIIIRQNYDE